MIPVVDRLIRDEHKMYGETGKNLSRTLMKVV